MWFSRQCCGGPVLAMFGICLGIGMMLLYFSALVPALVFIAAGAGAQGLCLWMGRSRCKRKLEGRPTFG